MKIRKKMLKKIQAILLTKMNPLNAEPKTTSKMTDKKKKDLKSINIKKDQDRDQTHAQTPEVPRTQEAESSHANSIKKNQTCTPHRHAPTKSVNTALNLLQADLQAVGNRSTSLINT